MCLPCNFKDDVFQDRDFTYTDNHWSNLPAMERYMDKVMAPCLSKTKERVSKGFRVAYDYQQICARVHALQGYWTLGSK